MENTVPRYVATHKIDAAKISTANTNRDGTGTVVVIYTAGANGSRIPLIRVVAEGTTTAGVVRIFLSDGVTKFLLKEILVTAVTPSTSTEVFAVDYQPTEPILLESGWTIEASTNNAETFNVFAVGGDY